MTLCQYYDQYARKNGYNSWNHLCVDYQIPALQYLKKQLKREYKSEKNEAKSLKRPPGI